MSLLYIFQGLKIKTDIINNKSSLLYLASCISYHYFIIVLSKQIAFI